ncbi:MAG TPA: asparagine synthase-related protein [Methylomirabilota bacterium]|nr:asparagine synthase-related protein [Methylomirabilota bacterium]
MTVRPEITGQVWWDADRRGFRHETTPPALAQPDGRARVAVGEPAGGHAEAIVDAGARTLDLATDPWGIRPLYYWSDGQRVVFATRLPDLLRAGGLTPELDPAAVYHYLNFAYVPGPGTIYRDVFVLPPGTIARCREGKVAVEPAWDMRYPADARGSEARLAAALREEIERAVAGAWAGAGPAAGCFLSGGTDSGTIAAVLAQRGAGLPAYSIAFAEDAYDELRYARLLAARHGLAHHVHVLSVDDLLASVPVLGAACDQPFGNPSAVATWRCARLARETGVDVLLAGDGGDELFGGNERYRKDRVYGAYHRLPRAIRAALRALAAAAPAGGLLLNRMRNVTERGDVPNPERLYTDDALASRRWEALIAPALRARVVRTASLDVVRGHWDRVGPVDEIDRLMYVDLKTAIWGNDLVKVAAAARAAGLRVRFPFLDTRLAELTGRLGGRMKLRGLEKRYLFKRAVADLLPPDVLGKPKHGFGVPVAEWVRHDRRVREVVLDPILDPASPLDDYLTRRGREELVAEHLAGRWDHGTWLWALMMLARWRHAMERAR